MKRYVFTDDGSECHSDCRLDEDANGRWVEYAEAQARIVELGAKVICISSFYEAIMSKLESEKTIRYYRCGTCGGPVASGLCCVWCDSKDPMEMKIQLPVNQLLTCIQFPQKRISELESEIARLSDRNKELEDALMSIHDYESATPHPSIAMKIMAGIAQAAVCGTSAFLPEAPKGEVDAEYD